MSDAEKIDRVLEHILEIKTALAEIKGARLQDRLDRLEKDNRKDAVRWAKVTGGAAVVSTALGLLARKLGF